MNRKEFIKLTGLASLSTLIPWPLMSKINHMNILEKPMPVLFMGHGSPMNAIEDNIFTRGWANFVKDVPKPKAIMVISAHWETKGTKVLSSAKPKLIYDMYGFPKKLYETKYDVKGSPELAKKIIDKVKHNPVSLDDTWGLDHGAWSLLLKMYPKADIPCFQLSLDKKRDLQWHYDLAKELSFLRKKGVLIVSSGNIVHNLKELKSITQRPSDWAIEFDSKVASLINNGDHKQLINYKKLGKAAITSVNSAEHYLPLIYSLGLKDKNDKISYTNHTDKSTELGSWMRCVKFSQ